MNETPDIKVLTDKRRGLICVSIATRGFFLMDDILIMHLNMIVGFVRFISNHLMYILVLITLFVE